jgi:hypothetical protein
VLMRRTTQQDEFEWRNHPLSAVHHLFERRQLLGKRRKVLNGRNGEGFGMPFGVAKPPMQEPAVRMRRAMGFSDLA